MQVRKRLAMAPVLFLAVVFAAAQTPRLLPGHSQQAQQLAHPTQPTDPSGNNQRFSQRPSIEEGMRHAVNPCNRDYGRLLYGWQDTAVQYTIDSWVWWFGMITAVSFLAALVYIWWLNERWDARQDCFARAAAILIGQRNTAYQRARFAIDKHNELVLRFDSLFGNLAEARRRQQVADHIEAGRESSQPLFPVDGDDVASIGESGVAVVEVQSATPRGEQIVKFNGAEFVPVEAHRRRVHAFETKIKAQRTAIQQLKDRLSQIEGTK
jgi:hypothetical protein